MTNIKEEKCINDDDSKSIKTKNFRDQVIKSRSKSPKSLFYFNKKRISPKPEKYFNKINNNAKNEFWNHNFINTLKNRENKNTFNQTQSKKSLSKKIRSKSTDNIRSNSVDKKLKNENKS